ncbi:dTDP-4-dehydrorhamnose reductase [Ostreibacterium oceani]|uniref:dTDP-4-dehydrorhamnose reductase n=1 Tax=Ostreibacterium oceani TaxID=2654998 RepID=A0A6N7EUT4_9GAMM|nr:dTDP-4-dehydrorhamnose reductase [Ostreibacterium oceani]MPV85733.1 dTDP-4-dehydrorhamnose reductase [Ostreibacterium oceani]
MKIVVIGKQGQLGRYLQQTLGDTAVYLSRDALDMADTGLVFERLMAFSPDIIVNASAYTDTSRAEKEPGLAYAVNAASVAEIARVAAHRNATLIHVSTDYVFDGEKVGGYQENDTPNPLNVYGASKRLGELLIQKITEKHIIIRTSWVFSEFGQNFVKTIVNLAKKRDELEIVSDQFGCPTYAGHLAVMIAQLVHTLKNHQDDPELASKFGLYHYADSPACSWFDFGNAIVALSREAMPDITAARILPVAASHWPSNLVRPKNGELCCQHIAAVWGVKRHDWQSGLVSVVNQLASTELTSTELTSTESADAEIKNA